MSGLLGLESTNREEILQILDLAEEFVGPDEKTVTPPEYRNALDGGAIGLMFFEPSTRTRASFELAVHRLGGYPLIFQAESSSIQKGESELDTCQNLEAMGVRAFVIRHAERRVPLTIADHLGVPVFNAGNGSGEHPTQGLIDIFTLRRELGTPDLEGARVAIIGDIVHSRVARSAVYGLRALGARVTLAGPAQLMPTARDEWDVDFASSRAEALKDADALILLRMQRERMHRDAMDANEYVKTWGVDELVVEDEMEPDTLIMHPGPVIRGFELSSGVADSPRSLILKQAGFGVAIRQAVMLHVLQNVPHAAAESPS